MRLERGDGVPLSNVMAEIWHCDALGRYSGFPPPGPSVTVTAATAPKAEYLPGERFLRGRQITDAAGQAEFHTIYFPTGGVPAVLDIALSRDGYRAAACLAIVG